MLGALLGLINPLSRIAEKIADVKVEQARAATDHERIRAEERVKTLEARRAVMVAESGSRLNGLMRAGFALPFVIYNAKLVLWDKVLGWGTTDGLSAELFQVEMACIGFYFLYEVAARIRR
ncbi:MAG: hypothetical protein FJX62_13195 [Alphaproteobacteria bacterium]|nr:hypothetical protein [Alphaproteobacteria bacterium]